MDYPRDSLGYRMLEDTVLIGRTVQELFIKNDQSRLRFYTDNGQVEWETKADCCSESWFADVISPESLFSSPVTKIEIVGLPDPKDGRSRQEQDDVYGISLTTVKGVCDIAFRNSSSGYYGGSVMEAENIRPTNFSDWNRITTDYSA